MNFNQLLEKAMAHEKVRHEFLKKHNCVNYTQMIEKCDTNTLDTAMQQCEDAAINFRHLARAANSIADNLANRSDMLSKSVFK